jgi:NAD-reducing hydrogenase small subunit
MGVPPLAATSAETPKLRLATVWLDGCSGCHMSFLDLDERLISLAPRIQVVFGPLVDAKEFPENVDVSLVEGAVSSDEDLEKLHKVRARSKLLIALGDCAVTSNVPGMRNQYTVEAIERCAYIEHAQANPQIPCRGIPQLLPQARPVHEYVKVDLFVPGCPPPADVI